MKTRRSLVLQGSLALLIIALVGCAGAKAPEASESAGAATPEPASVVDDAGRTVEIAETPKKCVCCGYYNIHVNDEVNHKLHEDKLEVVREREAGGMAVECVTCWESFDEPFKKASVPLWELMVAAEQVTRPGEEVDNG